VVEGNRLAPTPRPLPPFAPLLFWTVLAFYFWGALSPVIVRFARRFPVAGRHRLRNLLLHVPAAPFFVALHLAVWAPFHWYFDVRYDDSFPTFGAYYRWQLTVGFFTKLMVYLIILTIVFAFDYYRKFRQGKLSAAELRAQLAQAQLQALKMQLHPHFLFNTLNAISELVYRDPETADQMVTQLSDMLRISLEQVGTQEVPLKQELEFLGKYLEIEQTRFRERLRVDMRIDPSALDACVPNMILQPIVENAVRHGVAPRASGGTIEIRAERHNGVLRLDVRDDGRGLVEDPFQSNGRGGVGLTNTRARLEHLYGAAHRFELRSAPGRGLTVSMSI
ncbi:MAG: sensor histidine kinase, partial [Pyrinomonadaceae bacterium]